MQENKLDLSVKKNAEASMNKTAMIGTFIINFVLFAAYLIEVFKKVRTWQSFSIVAILCILPSIWATVIYKKQADSRAIRFICGIAFLALYTYIMFTTSTDLTFCYIIVAFVIYLIYIDFKLLIFMGSYSLLVNMIRIAMLVAKHETTSVFLTNSEITIACLALTCIFGILAVKKIDLINQANINRANIEKQQSENLLNVTLDVASSMTDNIKTAVSETDELKSAITTTQEAMELLTSNVQEEVRAMDVQKESTNEIHSHIQGVNHAVCHIVKEVETAEKNLNTSNDIMKDLLLQVKESETSGSQVSQNMDVLKEYTGKMQDIMNLIRNVADQTSLLALNASIEAARAGDAGKGFAVVASEISSLSEQTNAATKDIDSLIENIIHSIEEVTTSVTNLMESNALQNQYVDITANNFKEIRNNTQGISSQVLNLQNTVDVVTTANNQVEEQIDNVSHLMQKIMNGASNTLENCNHNINSIDKVTAIMEVLQQDTTKLNHE